MPRICSHIAVLLLVLTLSACGAGKSLKKAEQSYALGEYFDAVSWYKKAYAKTPPKEREQRGVIAYKMGDCYDRINYTGRQRLGIV